MLEKVGSVIGIIIVAIILAIVVPWAYIKLRQDLKAEKEKKEKLANKIKNGRREGS
jgi:hypothetical protein